MVISSLLVGSIVQERVALRVQGHELRLAPQVRRGKACHLPGGGIRRAIDHGGTDLDRLVAELTYERDHVVPFRCCAARLCPRWLSSRVFCRWCSWQRL
jgi:hypothetical protein